MNNGKDISFEDGVFRVIEVLANNHYWTDEHYTKEYLMKKLDGRDVTIFPVASNPIDIKGQTVNDFINECRTFIKSLTGHKEFPFPDYATIIGARPEFENNPQWLARELMGFMNR